MLTFYGSEDGFGEYAEAMGYTIPDPTGDDSIEAALLRSSVWLDGRYRGRFPGYPTALREQVRAWPRFDAFDTNRVSIPSTEVPREMEYATYEVALRELAQPGVMNPVLTPGKIIKSVSVDGAVSVTYAGSGAWQDQLPVLSILEGILSPLFSTVSNSFSGRSVRA